MLASEYIALINITGGLLSCHLVFLFSHWVYRDWRDLWRLSAGLLVFVFLVAMILRGYESLYYGVARIYHLSGVDLWRDEPFVSLVSIVRTGSVLLLLGAYCAKVRADGRSWRASLIRTGLFALEGVVLAIAVYYWLIH